MAGTLSSDRARSPRAPKLSLGDAVSYARKIYDAVHRSTVDSYTVFQLMGFAGKSGSSATALGSLRQFGLIEGVGEKTRITDLAMKVFEPESDLEKFNALYEAANNPEVFRAIFDRFDKRVPLADEPIRAFLIRELGFSKSGAEDSIESFRDTLAGLEEAERHVRAAPAPRADVGGSSSSEGSPAAERTREHDTSPGERIRLVLTRECSAELIFSGEISDRAITNLLRHIELMREVWADS